MRGVCGAVGPDPDRKPIGRVVQGKDIVDFGPDDRFFIENRNEHGNAWEKSIVCGNGPRKNARKQRK
jgi:hypothetical protein